MTDAEQTILPRRKAATPIVRSLNALATPEPETTILVFGLGRGGTSAVAGALRELGVIMPNAHPLKHESTPIARVNGLVDKVATQENIEQFDDQYPVWGWKAPTDLYNIDEYSFYLRNPQIVMVFRNILDVCESACKHDDIEFSAIASDIGSVYGSLMGLVERTVFPVHILSFERLIAAPRAGVIQLAERLGLDCSREQIALAEQFLSADDYQSVSIHPHTGGISEADLQQDREATQTSRYTQQIRAYHEASAAMSADTAKARTQFAEQSGDVADLLRRQFLRRGVAVDPADLDRMVRAPGAAFLALISNLNRVSGAPGGLDRQAHDPSAFVHDWLADDQNLGHAPPSAPMTPDVEAPRGDPAMIAPTREQFLAMRAYFLAVSRARQDAQRDLEALTRKFAAVMTLGSLESPEAAGQTTITPKKNRRPLAGVARMIRAWIDPG